MLYINSDNQIYSSDMQATDRNLTSDESTLYMRGYGYEIKDGFLIDISQTAEYIAKQVQERKTYFETNFFETSLGWIRRKATIKITGEEKDFICDCLPIIKTAVTADGLEGKYLIRYKLPDFTKELTKEYLVSLQDQTDITATQFAQFAGECVLQFGNDFIN